jgi:hypothetical protein
MNVNSVGRTKKLGLALRSLEEVGSKGLSMRTADYRKTMLLHWIWLRVSIEGIVRDIRCFVAPELPHVDGHRRTEYMSLILGLPWVYLVDAKISIRESTTTVGDVRAGETVRDMIGPELVFCKNNNLLMYSRSVMVVPSPVTVEDDTSSSSKSDSSDSESDVEEVRRPEVHFH